MAARVAWVAGALYGMTGVMLGAIGAHALRGKLSASLLASYQVGARYQMVHALALLCLGLLAMGHRSGLLSAAIGCIIAGVFCFSGSIYALTVLRWKVGLITPLGGVLMIIGWGCLLVAAWKLPLQPAQGAIAPAQGAIAPAQDATEPAQDATEPTS